MLKNRFQDLKKSLSIEDKYPRPAQLELKKSSNIYFDILNVVKTDRKKLVGIKKRDIINKPTVEKVEKSIEEIDNQIHALQAQRA